MSSPLKRLQSDYQLVIDCLTELELIIDMNPLFSFPTRDRTTLSWSATAGLSYLFTDYATIEQYVEILNRRDFSVCLSDGGLLQIKYCIEGDEIVSHRLCYIPCPFEYILDDWEGYALAEIPEMLNDKDLLRLTRLASPLRFDYERDFSDEKHAHAHVSINKQSCRIPAYGPVSLGHFLRFVFRYFYEGKIDDANESWKELNPKLFVRKLGHPAPHEFYIESSTGFM